ncbi:divergent polysaccharide deacetylase family protein [Colwellia sp. M166]|uniref:divergent polysaccharide deacetylase family protein n=1 Tax=Colwellia sp. M166 TaxID=2583805 RepID=UPI00211E7271|nr:divergent polysaccharide deacetylase family protein [Colwellia sp. M166]UUO23417.1 divergent polysaccharide deacetylase family protein [Colwellia sp. M166]
MLRLLLILSLLCPFLIYAQSAQVAIIIDDLGYRKSDVQALYLPGAISYAILPHTPYGKSLALQAKGQNNEVILHIPMEAKNGKKLGPGALTSTMNESSIRQSLTNAFTEIPFALGINNHMGSKLTELYQPMAWTMQFLSERNLMFVDSMTTSASQAEKIAINFGVPSLHRHIFLDNKLEYSYIQSQFEQLIRDAKRYHGVVAIAHPHPETIAALFKLLPLLKQNKIELVAISTLLSNQAMEHNQRLNAED